MKDTYLKEDATAGEIYNFMVSNSTDVINSKDNSKSIDKERLKKWKETLQKSNQADKESYKKVIEKIDILLNAENPHNVDTSNVDASIIKAHQKDNNLYIYEHDAGDTRDNFDFTDVLDSIDDYKPSDTVSSNDKDKITNKASIVLTTVTNIAMIMAVLIPAILGIKYMLGSIEEKAEYKKDMLPYLIGAVLVFGITTIVKVIQLFGETINNL